MKKIASFLFILFVAFEMHAQNSLGIQAGYLNTHTSVAEYQRPGWAFFLMDYVSLNPNRNSAHVALTADIDLGKRFFLSTGLHYEEMGISKISFTDTLNRFYSYAANEEYIGWSLLLKYHYRFNDSKFGIFAAAGPKIDFVISYLNAAEQAPLAAVDFITPFARFNVMVFSIAVEAGCSYKLGPGEINLRVNYYQGLSDVLRDDYLVGRTRSLGIDIGYTLYL
ncbi:MAG: outer membrane beta-barrel protein [bacterium]